MAVSAESPVATRSGSQAQVDRDELVDELRRRLDELEGDEYRASDSYRLDPAVLRSALAYLVIGVLISVVTMIVW
jgi:hypothetical protein